MKFNTRRITEQAEHTIDGITAPITRTRTVSVPKLPRDWDSAAVRGASGLVLGLTLVSITWSTWSIGSLLQGGIGYATATIFDIAWAVCLLLEWLSRYDADKRQFPRRLGWGLLLCTMAAIFWHGMTRHSVALAVVGAAVSFFAKVLWLGVMKHVDRDLSADDAQWVAAQISAANAKLAVAGVRRQVARQEARAVLELTAMEAERAELSMALGVPLANLTVAAPHAVAPAATAATDAASAAWQDGTDDDLNDEAPLEPPTMASLSKADAVRIALKRRPGYTARQISDLLAAHDVTVSDSYVRQIKARDAANAAPDTAGDADAASHGTTATQHTDADVVPIRRQN